MLWGKRSPCGHSDAEPRKLGAKPHTLTLPITDFVKLRVMELEMD
jgi:hypothetical protein